MDIIVFAVFMLLWKAQDTFITYKQMKLQVEVEKLNRKEETPQEPVKEEVPMGFVSYTPQGFDIEEKD